LVVKESWKILERNNLCVKPDKCKFEKDEMEFLVFCVGNGMGENGSREVGAIKD